MPDTDNGNQLSVKRTWNKYSKLVVVFVVVLLFAGAIFLHSQKQSKDPARTQLTSAQQIDAQIAKDTSTGNFSASKKALEQSPETEEYDVLRISMYRTEEDNKSALVVYKRLIAAGKSGYVQDAAEVAELAGDKPLAIKYYETAKQQLSKGSSPTKDADIAAIEERVAALKGQQ